MIRPSLIRLVRLPAFLTWFALQMIRANWQVATDILTPGSALSPAIVAHRTHSLSSGEITVLNNLITLTPGTLTLDIDDAADGGRILYVLGLYAPSEPEEFHAELRELEDRMLSLTRPSTPAQEVTR